MEKNIHMDKQIKNILKLAKIAPMLVIGASASQFGTSTIIKGNIPSFELGIIQDEKGLKFPAWLNEIVNGNGSHLIVIENVDSVDEENQEKFYELLKYKAISNVNLPKDCIIIVTAKNINKVSQTILSLCQIIK